MATIFSSAEFNDLADSIAKKCKLQRGEMTYTCFPDGWPCIQLTDHENSIQYEKIFYIGDISDPKNLFANLSVIQAFADYGASEVFVIFPFLPLSTNERVVYDGDVVTAKTFMRMLSSTPMAKYAKTQIYFLDLHAETITFYADDTISVENVDTIDLAAESQKRFGKVDVVFPDRGALKRYGKYFPEEKQILLEKVRTKESPDKRVYQLIQGDPNGKDIMLVDDMVRSGSTLIEAIAFLKGLGANDIYGYAAHGVFTKGAEKRISEHFTHFYTTNSIPENTQRMEAFENISVLDIGDILIKDVIKPHMK